jgi:GntP family gluconate:H+ symporter
VPFVVIQVIMVGLIIAFPALVSGGLGKKEEINIDNVQIEMQPNEVKPENDSSKLFDQPGAKSEPAKEEDPMAAFKDLPKDAPKK